MVEAATLRLRPILMTTGAMVLGSVPLALATGAGAESRQAIGWVIVGGLLLGTLLTLYVVPTAYMLLARTHRPLEPEAQAAVAPLPPNRSGDQQGRAGGGAALERPMRFGGLRQRKALVDLDLHRARSDDVEQVARHRRAAARGCGCRSSGSAG